MTAKPRWSCADVELLRRHYADSLTSDLASALGRSESSVLVKAHKMGLRKSAELLTQVRRETGKRGGFQAGHSPWNTGRKGMSLGGQATQFKPGHRPSTWVPVGSYTVNSDGYLDQKVNDDPGPRYVRWKPVHRLVWERAHGSVPKGHVVVFKRGRFTTQPQGITPDAIELIPRAELLRRNSIHNLPPELVSLTMLRGALVRQINAKAKEAEKP